MTSTSSAAHAQHYSHGNVTGERADQLQLSEAYLRCLFQDAADAVLLLSEKGLVGWNRSALALFDYPDTGTTCTVHPAHLSPEFQPDGQTSKDKASQMMEQVIQKGRHRFEWLHRTFTGREFWAEVVLTAVPDNDDMIIHSVVRDISDRKAAEAKVLQKSRELEQALKQLQQSQAQVVQAEKMSALGNLVAGVAHEINNPVGFLKGSIKNAQDYTQELLEHLALYQQHYPDAADAITDNAEDIDLDFLYRDLPKLLNSMEGAAERIKSISTSLRTFSRADTEHNVSANLHEGIDSTLLILKYRLKANDQRPAIQIVQNYGELSNIECFPGQLNQVFMNIFANAIDMFDEEAEETSFSQLQLSPQIITVTTALSQDKQTVDVSIQDNGKGMASTVREKIFDHLFTTKGVGKGTGLGLAIAKQIITEVHSGRLDVSSEIGQGTKFCMQLPIQ